jgi:hypothetical protein
MGPLVTLNCVSVSRLAVIYTLQVLLNLLSTHIPIKPILRWGYHKSKMHLVHLTYQT